jgi:hypothetical protein
MEGKLEQSQSILGEQREGDKPTAIMKKQQQMTQYLKLDFHLYYHFPYQIHYSNRLHDQRMILFYIPIVCVPELHKYGIANRLHTHFLYGHFQQMTDKSSRP